MSGPDQRVYSTFVTCSVLNHYCHSGVCCQGAVPVHDLMSVTLPVQCKVFGIMTIGINPDITWCMFSQ